VASSARLRWEEIVEEERREMAGKGDAGQEAGTKMRGRDEAEGEGARDRFSRDYRLILRECWTYMCGTAPALGLVLFYGEIIPGEK